MLLFALSSLGNTTLLSGLGLTAVWLSLLMSILLTLNKIIHEDFKSGVLDYLLISDVPIEITLFCKTTVHWVSVVIPLLIITPLVLFTFQISSDNIVRVVLILLLGSPSLSFVGMMISCLTLSNRSSLLLTTITIPFYFPTLLLGIFCCGSTNNNLIAFEYLLLYANTLFTIVISPFISAYAIKLNYS
jgi:heme exporter protein B|tara:strand:- start:798 stop:1361 length:564 start_codon:yes stop_codon:yes gene_type:complete